jgi:hypothetical protein
VLPEEDGLEYEEILRGFHESLQPRGAVEEALVSRLAQTHWRGLRSRRVETGMLEINAATQRARARQHVKDCPEHLNLHNAIGVSFLVTPPERWHTWLRYDSSISRDFFRTLDTLRKLQRARPTKREDDQPLVRPAAVVAAAGGSPAEVSDSGIRSDSQIKPRPMTRRNNLRDPQYFPDRRGGKSSGTIPYGCSGSAAKRVSGPPGKSTFIG